MERPGATTLRGDPKTLIGPELKPGDPAPDFEVVDSSLKPVTLAGTGATCGSSAWCRRSIRRFAMRRPSGSTKKPRKLPNVDIYTVSMDLPFAQKRWCGAFGVDKVKMLSDHKDGSFGSHYGTLIKELRIESRAIFVVGKDNNIKHAEYVKEVADFPNYETALAAARAAS